MKVGAPFAGPVSFPLLVIKDQLGYDLLNTCKFSDKFDIVLDSITNMWKFDYNIFAAAYIDMYSFTGNYDSKILYTVKAGTLADFNARLYARKTGKTVINTGSNEAVEMASKGYLSLVGNEITVGESFEKKLLELGISAPSCVFGAKSSYNAGILDDYRSGIDFIRENPDASAKRISEISGYYTYDVMRKIIKIYNHRLTVDYTDLKRSIDTYGEVEDRVKSIGIIR